MSKKKDEQKVYQTKVDVREECDIQKYISGQLDDLNLKTHSQNNQKIDRVTITQGGKSFSTYTTYQIGIPVNHLRDLARLLEDAANVIEVHNRDAK